MNIFFTILYQPLFNALIWLYNIIPGEDMGLAIIALTLIIRILLMPLTRKQLHSQKAMQELQPKVQEVKQKYKDDKEGQAKALMELYKSEKVNPLSSCLPLIVQIIILIALYRVFLQGLSTESLSALYSWVQNPGEINSFFLGIIDLAKPSIPLAIFAGIVQFFQAKMLNRNKPSKQVGKSEGARDEMMMANMNRMMIYFMPLITVVIGATLPGGLALYWFVSSLFLLIHQIIIFRSKTKPTEVVEQ